MLKTASKVDKPMLIIGLIRKLMLSALVCCFTSCQKSAHLGPEADPLSILEPPPMGASTFNDELKQQLILLDDILNHRLSEVLKIKIKKIFSGHLKASLNKNSAEAYIVQILTLLPELIEDKKYSDNKKAFYKAKLYFLHRRFIEAATQMTYVLKEEPRFYEARNLRARAIFFLGNLDLAVKELQKIIEEAGQASEYGLDSLYLIGAMIYESNQNDKYWLQKGIGAWNTYLSMALESDLIKDINSGLKELAARLDETQEKKYLDPFVPNPHYQKDKNSILEAFMKEELLLSLKLAEDFLKKTNDPEIATIRARIIFKNGRHNEAKLLFDEIVQKFPKFAPGYHYLGMSYMMRGQPKQAIESWQMVAKLDQEYASKHGLSQRIAVAKSMLKENRNIEMH
jgi:tetratricopeptide (TPR) repeat protein